MPIEPTIKRTYAFFDGQNLYRAAKEAFGYHWPNYDPLLLAKEVCRTQNWTLEMVYFYTGIPDKGVEPLWYHFWVSKLAAMGTRQIITFSRPLRYRNEQIELPDGTTTTKLVAREKGIDIRIALDVVRMARTGSYDVALVFSQDQDFSEVADEVKNISISQNRWIKVASAFPVSPTSRDKRGIERTSWVLVDRACYDQCVDPTDYRMKKEN